MARIKEATMTKYGLSSVSLIQTEMSRTVSQMKETLMRYIVNTLEAMLLTMPELKCSLENKRKTKMELRYRPTESYSKQRCNIFPIIGSCHVDWYS